MELFSGKITASIGSSKEIAGLNKKKKKKIMMMMMMMMMMTRIREIAFGRSLARRTDGTYKPVGHLYS